MGLDELLEDLLGVAAEVDDRRALVKGGQLRGQRERVGERQEQVGRLARLDELELLDHLAHRHRVAMGEHDALGRSGGARRVDDRVGVLGLDRRLALAELRGVADRAALAQLVQRDLAAAGLDPDRGAQLRQLAADLLDLGQLVRVLAEHRAGARVAEHPFAFARRVGGIDRHHHGAGGRDPVAGQRPLQPRVGQDADAVAGLDPERRSGPSAISSIAAGDLGIGHLAPLAVDLVARGDAVAEALGRRAGSAATVTAIALASGVVSLISTPPQTVCVERTLARLASG